MSYFKPFLDCLTLKMEATSSFEKTVTIDPRQTGGDQKVQD